MTNLDNWTEITKGLYRYIIAAKVCYEIHVMKQHKDFNVANLYIVGEWRTEDGISFERELLLERKPIESCLIAAYEDDNENNS